MAGEDGKHLLENAVAAETLDEAVKGAKPLATREAIAKAIVEQDKLDLAKPKEEIPEGCVRRVLNFKDRNYLVGACLTYCQKDGHKKLKDQKKLDQLKKLLNFEATLDHLAEMTDAIEELNLNWEVDMARYKTWKRYSKGLLDEKETSAMKERYPDLDLEKGPEKPPLRVPKLPIEVRRGPDSTFHLPSKLDAWVQDALQVMDWPPDMEEFAVEVCEKFGVEEGK